MECSMLYDKPRTYLLAFHGLSSALFPSPFRGARWRNGHRRGKLAVIPDLNRTPSLARPWRRLGFDGGRLPKDACSSSTGWSRNNICASPSPMDGQVEKGRGKSPNPSARHGGLSLRKLICPMASGLEGLVLIVMSDTKGATFDELNFCAQKSEGARRGTRSMASSRTDHRCFTWQRQFHIGAPRPVPDFPHKSVRRRHALPRMEDGKDSAQQKSRRADSFSAGPTMEKSRELTPRPAHDTI